MVKMNLSDLIIYVAGIFGLLWGVSILSIEGMSITLFKRMGNIPAVPLYSQEMGREIGWVSSHVRYDSR
jgi:hypothetical protein